MPVPGTSPTSGVPSSTHSSRPLNRVSNDSQNQIQLTNGSGNNNNTNSSKSIVKRSVSQVPTTDRRPLTSPINSNNPIMDNLVSNLIPTKDIDEKQVYIFF